MTKSPLFQFARALTVFWSIASPLTADTSIRYVTVGNPDNPADASGYGSVDHLYSISKYEVTISQYAEFLNAQAKEDPYGLYDTRMGSDANIAGITRSGISGSFIYTVVTGSENRPITYVSWFNAARFANWIHNGKGNGNTGSGAYPLYGATTGIYNKSGSASVWIPSENEWYKAAYYDPTKGGVGGYWAQATQSDDLAGNTVGTAVSANFFDGDFAATQLPGKDSIHNYLTDVGAYGLQSRSYYGTYDQGGNVFEWNDAVVSSTNRGIRGGGWSHGSITQSSSYRSSAAPSTIINMYKGFRLAARAIIYNVTVYETYTGNVVTNADSFFPDEIATLTAVPTPGYLFVSWYGAAAGTSNPTTIVMDSSKLVGANFTPDTNDDDDDGFTNYEEIVIHGTNPALWDTDGDDVKDSLDAFPLDPAETLDTDHDGTGDNADTDDDGDGLPDVDELTIHHTNPKRADSDGDGLSDPDEIQIHLTNPNLADTDDDGLGDGAEFLTHHTNPLVGDTDNDGFLDGYEVLTGKLPLNPLSKPALVAEVRTAIEFTFPAAVGKTYRIEDSFDLSEWGTVESGISGNGSQIVRFYTTRNMPKRYFRVEEE